MRGGADMLCSRARTAHEHVPAIVRRAVCHASSTRPGSPSAVSCVRGEQPDQQVGGGGVSGSFRSRPASSDTACFQTRWRGPFACTVSLMFWGVAVTAYHSATCSATAAISRPAAPHSKRWAASACLAPGGEGGEAVGSHGGELALAQRRAADRGEGAAQRVGFGHQDVYRAVLGPRRPISRPPCGRQDTASL